MTMIYKLLRPEEWAALEADGASPGSPDDVRDGFIHFSTAGQLAGTLAKHFSSAPELVLAGLDPAKLGDALRWETSRGGELFPHLYGPLKRADIGRVWRLNAPHALPDGLA